MNSIRCRTMRLTAGRSTRWRAISTGLAAVLVGLTAAARAAAGGTLEHAIPAGEYRFTPAADGRESVAIDGFGTLAQQGKPALPSKIFMVAIPPGVQVDEVSISPAELQPVSGRHNIAPALLEVPLSATAEELAVAQAVYEQTVAAAYASNDPWPPVVGTYEGSGGYRRYNLVLVRFTPLRYHAVDQTLEYCPSIKITVQYSPSTALAKASAVLITDNNAESEAQARKIIANYDTCHVDYPKPVEKWTSEGEAVTSTSVGFIIITTEALVDAVTPLANWERCKGRNVRVRTVEYLDSSQPGEDRAERIRNYLRANLASYNLGYAMFIGAWDDVPMCRAYKEGPCGWGDPNVCWEVLDYTPTDYYYAELSLPDSQSWDSHDLHDQPTRGEQAFDAVQFPNEISVGRLPLDDPAEVEAACRKMANYEYSNDLNYKLRYLLASSFFWPDTDAAHVSEYLYNNDLLPASHAPVRIYEHEAGCYQSVFTSEYDLTPTITGDVWANQFNDGPFGFVNLIGHGSPFSLGFRGRHPDVIQCPEQSFITTADAGSPDDAYPAMVYGNGCSTAEMEETNNLPQEFLRQGAVGFVGPTRNALGTRRWTNPSDGSSQSLNYWFCHYAVTHRQTRLPFGEAFQMALRHMYDDNGWNNDWGQFFEWNFFGNPDMKIGGRPSGLPNLQVYTPAGWTLPLVLRSTGDATFDSCVMSSILPGNTDDTYFNCIWRNSGSVASPTNTTVISIDGQPLMTHVGALGVGSNSTQLNKYFPQIITGGRHTVSFDLDVNEMVWEVSESDNCLARQFVWAPPLMQDSQPLNVPRPAIADAISECAPLPTFPNCDGFGFDVWPNYPGSGGQWALFSLLRPSSSACTARLWGPGSYADVYTGFGPNELIAPIEYTGATELIVVNGAVAPRGTYYAGISGSANVNVEYRVETSRSKPVVLGTNGPYVLDGNRGAADLYEITLQPGTWRFVVDQSSSTCDLGISIYGKDVSIARRVGSGVIGSADAFGVAMDESVDVTVTTAGNYAAAVWRTDASDFSKSATYSLIIGALETTCTPADPFPADGSTTASVVSDLDWGDCANASYYRVYMKEGGAASFDFKGTTTASTIDPGTLAYGTTYEWYVLAYNLWGDPTVGPTWSFTTRNEPDLVVVTPNGGEVAAIGDVLNIQWTSNDCRGLVNIQLSRSSGLPGTWETIASNVGVMGSFAWTVTGPISTQCRIKIAGGVCTDTSDADFAISTLGITVTRPNTVMSWYLGTSEQITWTSRGVMPTVKIELTKDNGARWTTLEESTPNDGRYTWEVRGETSLSCRIRITDTGHPSVFDVSDTNFAIRDRSIVVTAPNGGETWAVGTPQNVSWTANAITGNLRIELSRDAGGTWDTLATSVPATSPWIWPLVQGPASTQCRIRVTSLDFPTETDSSNTDFTIACTVPADSDCDGDVDWDDWLNFQACDTGPALSYLMLGIPADCPLSLGPSGFLPLDFDQDADVDSADFGVFQRCYTNGMPVFPECDD